MENKIVKRNENNFWTKFAEWKRVNSSALVFPLNKIRHVAFVINYYEHEMNIHGECAFQLIETTTG